MGIKDLDIQINGGQSVFYPGQTVQGNVTLEVESDTKVREIRLRFRGYSDVHWIENQAHGSGKNRRTYTEHYRNHETYFDNITKLLVPDFGEDHLTMKPGQYTYAFSFQLPDQCASSFEGSLGLVRYYLNAVVDRPWAFDNKHFHPFTVIQLLDLNSLDCAKDSASNSGSQTLCCWCCKSGPITGNLHLGRIAYVPGERIFVQGEVCNHSRRAMKNHQINLIMNVSYHTRTKTRVVPTEVAELRKLEVRPGETDHWNGEGLVVPPLPASGLPGCNIISIDYTVELQVVPSGIAFDLSVPVGVIIGSIPLRSIVQQYGAPANKPITQPSAPPIVSSSAAPPTYGDIYHNNAAYPPPPRAMMPPDIQIRLRFRGYADVYWTETKTRGGGRYQVTYTEFYTNHETYFNRITKLLVPDRRESQLIMQPGKYTYTFSMKLPDKCATSFESNIGRVRYYLQAIVVRPWAFDTVRYHPFTVIQLLDLNSRGDALKPASNSGSKMLCCLCCKSGPITGNLHLDRIGYVPGERITVRGEVCNHSRRKMKNHQVNLVMVASYHATSKTKKVETKIAELRQLMIDPGDTEYWNGESLVVPPVPASGLPGCRIISIDYKVELRVVPTGLALDLTVPIRVTIGNIPLKSTVEQNGIPTKKPVLPPITPSMTNPSASPPSYSEIYHNDAAYPPPPEALMPSDIPPPSYGRSVLGAMSGDYHEGKGFGSRTSKVVSSNKVQPADQPANPTWAPVYPYYDWNRPDANFTVTENGK